MTAPVPVYVYKVLEVKEVHDGDTIRFVIDQGLGDSREFWARIKGIDTYELRTEQGQIAQKFLEEYLKAANVIVIQTFKTKSKTPEDLMTFSRYVADVWADGLLIADVMRTHGFAKPVEHLG